jgi:putative membrane protein
MRLIFSILINAIILYVLWFFMSWNDMVSPWIIISPTWVDMWKTLLLGWLILWIMNVTIKPILNILSLPFYLLFFGLVAFVVNWIILWWFTYIVNVLLVIPDIEYKIPNTFDFAIAVAIFTILNMVYSILFFKR